MWVQFLFCKRIWRQIKLTFSFIYKRLICRYSFQWRVTQTHTHSLSHTQEQWMGGTLYMITFWFDSFFGGVASSFFYVVVVEIHRLTNTHSHTSQATTTNLHCKWSTCIFSQTVYCCCCTCCVSAHIDCTVCHKDFVAAETFALELLFVSP